MISSKTIRSFLSLILISFLSACGGQIDTAVTTGDAQVKTEEITLKGKLLCRIEDAMGAGTSLSRWLIETPKASYELSLKESADPQICGLRVAVTGRFDAANPALFLVTRLQALEPLGPPIGETHYKSTYKTLVILLHDTGEQDVAHSVQLQNDPATPAEIKNWVFEDPHSAASYYKETTFNGIQITGDVAPRSGRWYAGKLKTATECSYRIWAEVGDALATANGFNLDEYDHRIYILDRPSARCGWTGANEGFSSYLNGWSPASNINVKVLAHEMGHSLGLQHASALECHDPQGRRFTWADGTTPNVECSQVEYGDLFDVMGADWNAQNSARHFNILYKSKLAEGGTWLSLNRKMTVPRTGRTVIKINPLEQSSEGTQFVAIPGPTVGLSMVLEARTSYGFDNFDPNAPAAQGVLIREYTLDSRTRLVDTTPETATYEDAALMPGRGIYRADFGVTINVFCRVQTGVQVEICLNMSCPMPPAFTCPLSIP